MRIGKARQITQLGDRRRRIDRRQAAHGLQRPHYRDLRLVRQYRLDLRRQPMATRLNIILEHEMMHRLLEFQTREPPAMQLGPRSPPVIATLVQQKPKSRWRARRNACTASRRACTSRASLRARHPEPTPPSARPPDAAAGRWPHPADRS
jgi:hypothetical protein